MPKRGSSLKRIAIETSVAILVGLLIYIILGVGINLTSVAIYSQYSRTPVEFKNFFGSDGYPFNIQINNNAALSLPYINPFYSVTVSIVGDNSSFAYFKGVGDTIRNFTETGMDIGKVDSGSSFTAPIFIHAGGGSFNVTVKVWYYFIFAFQAKSATYSFESDGNNGYGVTQIS